MSNEAGARPKQSKKSGCEEDVVQISDDLFMYSNQPLRGGADVYKGYQLHASGDRRPLAIKQIVPCLNSHLREVQHLLALASHPNIVQIIQSKEHGGYVRVLFIAMELCSSQNLQDYLDRNRKNNISFDFDQTMSFTKQLVSGMKHIHVNKIVHRDLKLGNILVSEDGEHIKVSDFGLSKRVRLGKSQTRQTKLGVGTDGYRAPETFVSDTIGPSADIFSLGAIIYSMWSNGNHPFGNNVHLVNNNIINNEGRDLSGLLISGTKENQLHNLIDWMLHPDPRKRPTIEQVAQHPFFKSGPIPAVEDNSNEASSSEKTGEKSSPQRPSTNLPAEQPRPTTRLSAVTHNNSAQKDPSNNASSIQQRGMKPSSLRNPPNEDTLTEPSRSILHHLSATNIPPPTPDPNNRSNLSQQPAETSSPKGSDNVKTLSERFKSELRLPPALKEVASKEDTSNNLSSNQQRGMEPSLQKTTNDDTLTERSRSILHHPSAANPPPHTPVINRGGQAVMGATTSRGQVKRVFGKQGSNPGCLNEPWGIASGPNGSIVVADTGNHRIQVFDPVGRSIRCFGSQGSGPGQFLCPCGASVSPSGLIAVADNNNHRIQIFSWQGRYIREFGKDGPGELRHPWSVKFGSDELVYVTACEGAVKAFSVHGDFIYAFGGLFFPYGSDGSEVYVTKTSEGKVVVLHTYGHFVGLFSESWDLLWGRKNVGFEHARAVDCDKDGNIIIGDNENDKIQVFDKNGDPIWSFGSKGSNPGQFEAPRGIAVLQNGDIAVSDANNHRIQIFSSG